MGCIKCSCKNCDKRHQGCHSDCEEYKIFTETMKEIKQKRYEAKKLYSTCYELFQNRCKELSHGKYKVVTRYTDQ